MWKIIYFDRAGVKIDWKISYDRYSLYPTVVVYIGLLLDKILLKFQKLRESWATVLQKQEQNTTTTRWAYFFLVS